VHAYIISALRKDMPSMFGKDNKKKELIKNLGQIYDQIQREQQISPGDFPDLKKMQECLAHQDFTKFNPIKLKLLEVVDKMLAEDIAKLMAMIPREDITTVSEPLIKGLSLSMHIFRFFILNKIYLKKFLMLRKEDRIIISQNFY